MVFTDQLHRKVEMNGPPKRIVSLVPSQTELLFHLGLEERIVGITKFCIHPKEQVKGKVKVGGTKTIDLEKIIELQPDLIIANKEENDKALIEALEQHFPIWISDVYDLAKALKMIEQIGMVTDRAAQANALCKDIVITEQELKKTLSKQAPIPCAYFIWRKPYMIAGGDTYINSMLELAGFENVFGHLSRYPTIELDQLSTFQPRAILLSSEPFPFKEKHFDAFVNVCPHATVKLVDGEFFSWYGNRILPALRYFRELNTTITK